MEKYTTTSSTSEEIGQLWVSGSAGILIGTVVGMINMMVVGSILNILWGTSGMIVAGAVSGIVSGAIQGAFLRRSIYSVVVWLIVSGIGWVAAGVLGAFLISIWPNSSIDRWIPLGAISGAIVGTIQWLVLRRQIHHGYWWIIMNACVWALLALIYIALFGRLIGLSSW
jgi:hypothetical protein